MTKASDKAAVGRYLAYMADPTSIADARAIAAARTRLEATTDLVDKLHATAELRRAEAGDDRAVVEAFTAVAKAYSDEHDLTAADWLALGAKPEHLSLAGLAAPTQAPREPRRRVSRATVAASIKGMPSDFTAKDIAVATKASAGTVRAVLDDMVKEGDVKRKGNAPGMQGAPHLYTLTRKATK